MELLPAHHLKLKWLLSQTEKMETHDAQYVKDVSQALSEESNYKEAHLLTIIMIESMYDSYRTFLKGENNV